MTNRMTCILLTLLFPILGHAQSCVFFNAERVTPNAQWRVGPTMITAWNYNNAVRVAILAGRDAWDSTNAVNRIGDDIGTSPSDCSSDSSVQRFPQVGLLDFNNSPNCAAVMGYLPTPGDRSGTLAFVDYFTGPCSNCGTRSLTFNLAYAWSTNPSPGEYDIQSVAAHEFGHVLGFRHMASGVCDSSAMPDCTSNKETMARAIFAGETCPRSLHINDINNANSFYP